MCNFCNPLNITLYFNGEHLVAGGYDTLMDQRSRELPLSQARYYGVVDVTENFVVSATLSLEFADGH